MVLIKSQKSIEKSGPSLEEIQENLFIGEGRASEIRPSSVTVAIQQSNNTFMKLSFNKSKQQIQSPFYHHKRIVTLAINEIP